MQLKWNVRPFLVHIFYKKSKFVKYCRKYSFPWYYLWFFLNITIVGIVAPFHCTHSFYIHFSHISFFSQNSVPLSCKYQESRSSNFCLIFKRITFSRYFIMTSNLQVFRTLGSILYRSYFIKYYEIFYLLYLNVQCTEKVNSNVIH